jgi:hypothetical protein
MTTLVLVSGVQDVPEKVRPFMYIVSVNNWEDAVLHLSGRRQDAAMFWSRDVPVERLLKAVEDFAGNLLVYSEAVVDATMRSRFLRVMRGRQKVVYKEMGEPSSLEELLARVKAAIFN